MRERRAARAASRRPGPDRSCAPARFGVPDDVGDRIASAQRPDEAREHCVLRVRVRQIDPLLRARRRPKSRCSVGARATPIPPRAMRAGCMARTERSAAVAADEKMRRHAQRRDRRIVRMRGGIEAVREQPFDRVAAEFARAAVKSRAPRRARPAYRRASRRNWARGSACGERSRARRRRWPGERARARGWRCGAIGCRLGRFIERAIVPHAMRRKLSAPLPLTQPCRPAQNARLQVPEPDSSRRASHDGSQDSLPPRSDWLCASLRRSRWCWRCSRSRWCRSSTR